MNEGGNEGNDATVAVVQMDTPFWKLREDIALVLRVTDQRDAIGRRFALDVCTHDGARVLGSYLLTSHVSHTVVSFKDQMPRLIVHLVDLGEGERWDDGPCLVANPGDDVTVGFTLLLGQRAIAAQTEIPWEDFHNYFVAIRASD